MLSPWLVTLLPPKASQNPPDGSWNTSPSGKYFVAKSETPRHSSSAHFLVGATSLMTARSLKREKESFSLSREVTSSASSCDERKSRLAGERKVGACCQKAISCEA